MPGRATSSAAPLRAPAAPSLVARRVTSKKSRVKRAAWLVHRALGLGFGALILVMSLTGGVLVMHHEVERLIEPGRHVIAAPAPGATRVPIADVVRAVAADAPAGYRPLRYLLARDAAETERLLFVAPDGRTRWTAIANPYTSDILWRGADQSLFTSWLLGLHMHLRLGGWGHLVTGLAGVGLLLLGLTGLYIYRARWREIWRAPMRFNRGARAAFADLHRWLGLVSIYFSVMLGLTGAIYTIKVAPGQIAAPKPQLSPQFAVAHLAPIEPALAATRARFPDGELLRVSFPTAATAPLTVLVLHRDAPVWRKFSRIEFDPATGAVRAVRDAAAAAVSEKFSAMLAPLHFGFYGSPLVKWLYVVGGFSPALLAVSGTALWWLRRCRDRDRPGACQ